MTLAEIKDKKLTCVVHTKTKAEAKILVEYIPQRDWRKNPLDYWDVYAEETSYYIEDGQVFKFSPVSFYKDRYPLYGEIYEFSDLFATGGVVSIHDLPTSEWYNSMRLDLSEFVFDAEQARELAERLNKELA